MVRVMPNKMAVPSCSGWVRIRVKVRVRVRVRVVHVPGLEI